MKECNIAGVIFKFNFPKSYHVVKHTENCNVSRTAWQQFDDVCVRVRACVRA